jgi:hypothetical protein
MEDIATASTRRKEACSRYYRNRYNTDPSFREKERQRAAAYISSRRDAYKQLWRTRYATKKAAAVAAAPTVAELEVNTSDAASP